MTDKEKIKNDDMDVNGRKERIWSIGLINITIKIKDQKAEEVEDYSKALADKSKECEDLNISFQKFCDKDNEIQRYKQALDEVEQLIKNMEADECVYNDFDCSNCSEDNTCPTKVKSYILKIIKKAKDGE